MFILYLIIMKAKAATPAWPPKLQAMGKGKRKGFAASCLPSWHAKLQATPKRKAPKGSIGVLLAAKPKTEGAKPKTGGAKPKTGGAEAIAELLAIAYTRDEKPLPIGAPPKGKAKGKGKVIATRAHCASADELEAEKELLRLQMIWKDRNDSTKPENREPWTRSPRGQVTERLAAERLAAQCKAQGLEARAKARAAWAEPQEQLAAQCKAQGLEARAQARAAWQNQGSAAASSSSAGPRFENTVLRKSSVKVVKS